MHILRAVSLTWLSLLLSSATLAQPAQQWSLELTGDLIHPRIHASADGAVYVSAAHGQFFYGDPSYIRVFRLTQDGSLVWSYQGEPNFAWRDSAPASDGGLYIAITELTDPFYNEPVQPLVRKLTSAGSVSWTLSLPHPGDPYSRDAQSVAVLRDSTVLVCSGGSEETRFSWVSQDGVLLDSQVLSTSWHLDRLEVLSDGRIVGLIGYLNSNGFDGLALYSEEGDLLGSRVGIGTVNAFQVLPGGELAVTVDTDTTSGLKVFSPGMDLLTEQTVSTEHELLRGLGMAPDGDVLVAGGRRDPGWAPHEAWLSKRSRTNLERWSVTVDTVGDDIYDWDYYDYFEDLSVLSDGGVLALHLADDGNGLYRMTTAIGYEPSLLAPSLHMYLLPSSYPMAVGSDGGTLHYQLRGDAVLQQPRAGFVQVMAEGPDGGLAFLLHEPVQAGLLSSYDSGIRSITLPASFPNGTYTLLARAGRTLNTLAVFDTLTVSKQSTPR